MWKKLWIEFARTSSLKLLSFFIYMLIVYLCLGILDIRGNLATKSSINKGISPHSLKAKEIKNVLKRRGVSCNGCLEKAEFVQRLEETGPILEADLEDFSLQVFASLQVVTFDSVVYFERSIGHGIWLVQIIPAYGPRFGEKLLSEEIWNSIVRDVTPYTIRTAIFNCFVNFQYCHEKGWDEPLLILAQLNGPREPIFTATKNTKKKAILEWMKDALITKTRKIQNFYELEELLQRRKKTVVFVTHFDRPSLTFTLLSNKFFGTIKFVQFIVRKENTFLIEKLSQHNITVPSFVISTRGREVVLQGREYKRMGFDSLSRFVESPDGDTWESVQWAGWNIVNVVTLLHIFQLCVPLWKKNVCMVAFLVWSLCSFIRTNLFYIVFVYSTLLLLCIPGLSLVVECLGTFLIYLFHLSSFGSLAFSDLLLLQSYPIIFYPTLFLFGVISSRVFTWPEVIFALQLKGPIPPRNVNRNTRRRRGNETSTAIQQSTNQRPRVPDTQRANIGTGASSPPSSQRDDSNLRFRVNLETREVEYTNDPEGVAYRNLRSLPREEFYILVSWIRLSHMFSIRFISNDYIRDLPTWRYDSSDYEEGAKCVVCQCEYDTRELLCGLPCGHYYHHTCISEWLPNEHTCPLCRWPAYRSIPNSNTI